jgi:hypothetical protein
MGRRHPRRPQGHVQLLSPFDPFLQPVGRPVDDNQLNAFVARVDRDD